MLISHAYAQTVDVIANVPPAPDPLWNFGMLAVMIILFYVLLIMPQQKRFKEHSKMLAALEKGDAVVTGGGLVGKVSKVISDEEVEVDLGNSMVVTVRRATISGKVGETSAPLKADKKAAKKAEKKVAANEDVKSAAPKEEPKKAAPKKSVAKKAPAKKTTKAAAKKTATKTAAKKPAPKKSTPKKAAKKDA